MLCSPLGPSSWKPWPSLGLHRARPADQRFNLPHPSFPTQAPKTQNENWWSYYPHWVRSPAAEPQERYANRPWLMWQYTAAGRVPGIRTDVDLNAFYGSSADWAKFLAASCDPRPPAQGACNGQTDSPVAQDAPEARPLRPPTPS